MKLRIALPVLLVVATLQSPVAHADITIGATLSLTGPGSSLGIPEKQTMELIPEMLAGHKVRTIILDDRSDPTQAVVNARKLTAEGIEARKEVAGYADDVLDTLVGGVQSGMGYLGARTLGELRTKARFVRISPAGQKEAAPHDVIEMSRKN